MRKFIDYFMKKSVKQRIYLIIGFVLLLVLCFFIIKGNIIDNNQLPNTAGEISSTTVEASADEPPDTTSAITFRISLFDVLPLIAVFIAYGIHKFRQAKKERRK